jgi:hypothetical protein
MVKEVDEMSKDEMSKDEMSKDKMSDDALTWHRKIAGLRISALQPRPSTSSAAWPGRRRRSSPGPNRPNRLRSLESKKNVIANIHHF